MIYFDVTKSARASHVSGLMRVNRRLLEKLGDAVRPVVWGKDRPDFQPSDWYLTTETFDVDQRPGFAEFMARPPCACNHAFVRLNGREPKNPRRAESGDGCAVSILRFATGSTVRAASCAVAPQSR